jgi:hypothetical protein
VTNGFHTRAQILEIDPERIRGVLDGGSIPIVAGFQGWTEDHDITVLGRGASDTTAVALAVALQADRCEILKDVDGIFTADPRLVPAARKLDVISYEEILELARAGVYSEERACDFERNYLASGGNGSLDAYFSRAYGRVVVREALRRNVVFFQHDLASDHALGEMHVVFCRNVLIYFGSRLRERALGTFAGCLERSGFLCLGMSESLSPSSKRAFQDFAEPERILRRRAG